MISPDEPLDSSAPLALQMAPLLCRRDPATGETCAVRHGLWQALRLMGLSTSPIVHASYLLRELAAAGRVAHRPRVLVSGAADYSMLAHVLRALGEREPEITVLDLCETPLYFSRWYAGRVGHAVRTVRTDILEFADRDPYDIVCTHAFLGEFEPAARTRMIANWRELLRPGGVAITVNRLRPNAAEAPVTFSAQQVRAFCATVEREAAAQRAVFGVDPAELVRQAERYALAQKFYPVHTRAEVVALFERAGFASVDCRVCAPGPEAARGATAPTVPGKSEYACVTATR